MKKEEEKIIPYCEQFTKMKKFCKSKKDIDDVNLTSKEEEKEEPIQIGSGGKKQE